MTGPLPIPDFYREPLKDALWQYNVLLARANGLSEEQARKVEAQRLSNNVERLRVAPLDQARLVVGDAWHGPHNVDSLDTDWLLKSNRHITLLPLLD